MVNIEVMYCPTVKRLVRGRDVKRVALKSGEMKVTATCPLHPNERLEKVRLPELQRDTYPYEVLLPGLSLPEVELPADPGWPDHPSPKFWEVFSKSVGLHLQGSEAQANWQAMAVEMWNDLEDNEKQILMERFRMTGRVEPQGPPGPPIDAFFNPALAPAVAEAARKNPESGPSVSVATKARYKELEAEIRARRTKYGLLRDKYLEFDTDARRAIKFDYDMIARIVGDKEYPKLIKEFEALAEKYGEGLYQ